MYNPITPIRIEPGAFYEAPAVRHLLGISSAALSRAQRTGALRATKRGTRTFFKGEWILAWLESAAARQGGEHAS